MGFTLFSSTLMVVFAFFAVKMVSATLPPNYQSLTAQQKQATLWQNIIAAPYPLDGLPTAEPGFFQLAHLLRPNFDKVSFTEASDEMPSERQKLIHVYGSVAKVSLNIFGNSTYSGLFKTGGVGIARLSLAKQDYTNFTPGMALKILIDGERSQNFQVMYSVDGQGTNKNFFANKFSNIIPPPESFILKLLGKAFEAAIERLPGTAQDKPESINNLGLYEQASVTNDGKPVAEVVAPYAVEFVPNPRAGWDPTNGRDVRINLDGIPTGTTLYTLVAKRSPTAQGEVIGQLVTEGPFVASPYEDQTLFFQHASKCWRA